MSNSPILAKHKSHWSKREFLEAALGGLGLFLFSLIINYLAAAYATYSQSNPVTDIILDNIPVFHVDPLITAATIFLILSLIVLAIMEPRRIPFMAKSLALFILIRSVFICLTHVRVFPGQVIVHENTFFSLIGLGQTGDQFFSGHTGLPYLMALAFWPEKQYRRMYLALSIGLGTLMLLAHAHYSIDIFAAFFITYTIFHLAKRWFPKDYQMFLQS